MCALRAEGGQSSDGSLDEQTEQVRQESAVDGDRDEDIDSNENALAGDETEIAHDGLRRRRGESGAVADVQRLLEIKGSIASAPDRAVQSCGKADPPQRRCRWLVPFLLLPVVYGVWCVVDVGLRTGELSFGEPLVLWVPPGDASEVEKIFLSGTNWLVSCVTKRDEPLPLNTTSLLEETAEALRAYAIRAARVHCWEPVPSPAGDMTPAERFNFARKPPAVLVTSGQGDIVVVPAKGVASEVLVARVLSILVPETEPSRSPRRKERVGKRPSEDVSSGTESGHTHEPWSSVAEDEEEEVNLD